MSHSNLTCELFSVCVCVCVPACVRACVRACMRACVCMCRLDFIYDLFEQVSSRNNEETLKMGTARKKPTVSSQFRVR